MYEEENAYPAGLVTLIPLQRHPPRKQKNEVMMFNHSFYKYRMKVLHTDGAFILIQKVVCQRIQSIQNSLKLVGCAPVTDR